MKIAISLFISAASLCLLISSGVIGQTPQQSDEESSRQIVLDRFNKARPLSEATAGVGSANSAAMKPPLYRRTGAMRIPGRRGARPPATEEIGITIWRLRPARDNDQGGRVLVLDGLKQMQYTPERIEANTPSTSAIACASPSNRRGPDFFTSSIASNTWTARWANRCSFSRPCARAAATIA